MITTKTRIAIIENNQPFSGLLKNMLFKVGVLSHVHFTSKEKFIEQLSKKNMQFDFVLFNSQYSEKSFIDLMTKNKMKYLAYGERENMTTEMINLAGLSNLMELPFTSEKLFSKLEKIDY
jgi:hypothetical protein